MKKRILSMLMVLVMVIGLLPDMALAAEPDTDKEIRYSIDGGTTWKEDSFVNILFSSDVRHAQNVQIELLQDITLTENNWGIGHQVLGGTDSEWIIDGKGHTIIRGVDNYAIMMFNMNIPSSTVTLKNITIDGGAKWEGEEIATRTNSGFSFSNNNHLLWVSNGAKLILDTGVILQNNHLDSISWAYGAAIMVGEGTNSIGTLIMKDGVVIKNNCANWGSAIYIDPNSVFNMEGGTIYGNYAQNRGGAVSSEGYFNMSGGEIYDNASGAHGGAVAITNKGVFTMSGGKIYKNKSVEAGGISIANGNTVLKGGNVTENESTNDIGGGIQVNDNGTLSISGNLVVTNNIGKDNTNNNVYLNSGKTITIADALDDTAQIGIITKDKPTDENFIDITGENQSDYSTHFKSDINDFCIIKADNNVVQLAIPVEYKITYNTGGGNIEDKVETYMSGTGCILPSKVTKEGYLFEGWYNNENCTGNLLTEISVTDTGDKQFYAKWNLDAKKGIHYNTNSNGDWQNKDFIVTAAEGYELSLSLDGAWLENLSVSDETTDGTLAFYVREKNTGIISQQISIGYKIDKTYPAINGIENGKTYEGDTTFSVLDTNLDIVTIDDNEITLTEGSYTIKADNKEHIIVATDKAGNIATVTITVKIVHNYGTEWSSDSKNHWHECIDTDCTDREGSKKDIAVHTSGEWIIDKEATKEEEGSKHKECNVCKKILETESIPKDVSASDGKVVVTTPVIGEDAPNTYAESTQEEIKEAVPLTEKEQTAVKNGSEIKIYLQVMKKEVTQEDKQIIYSVKKDYEIGEYIDVSMFKQIDGKETSPVKKLNKKIIISLVIPESLRNKNNNFIRDYVIIRHHSDSVESSAEILQGTYNEKTFTLTFETDRFSTYAIAYKDTAKQTNTASPSISIGGVSGGGYVTDYTHTASPSPSPLTTQTPVPTTKPSTIPTAKPSSAPTATSSTKPAPTQIPV